MATYKAPLRDMVTQVIAGDQWRGLEQAALMAGKLDHEAGAHAERHLRTVAHDGWRRRRLGNAARPAADRHR